jgi:radical SAM superfamily enzyme YgiQ (UPF0313 family)
MLTELTSADARAGVDVKPHSFKRLRIVLIKPSKYDDDGYVVRFWKGVLPSNTLNVLHGLTEDVKRRRVLRDIEIDVATFDETAEKIPVKKIIAWARARGTKLIVGLVGVQTNQWPRAMDLGRQFRAAGIDVIMGGFHTSGTINMLGEDEPDIREMIREKIVVVSGEVEESWGEILSDALHGRLKPIYSFAQNLQSLVDIGDAPPPVVSPRSMRHFAHPHFGTVDTSRGCPFSCSFCTIINVQGRKMRERSPETLVAMLRDNYLNHNISFYFFTDDNFARKKLWRQTFEAIIALRKKENIPVSFMMQVDLARKPKDFVKLAAAAGCTQVFIGMESVNPENLKAEGKDQNHVEEYQAIIKEWHDAGIAVHTGYIIGLPHDSKEQVARDVDYLMNTIRPDQASFFMLTPLPGSHDHREMKNRGEWMDPDFNKRDSFHATIRHPRMSTEEWTAAYEQAWKAFYSKENMIRVLSRWNHAPKVYWNLMAVYIWYKNAALIEKQHPMIAGFFRLKDRRARRPGFAVDPLPIHLWKRLRETVRLFIAWAKFLKEMEEVWLRSRRRSEREEHWLTEIQRIQGEIYETLRIAEWQKAYASAKTALPARIKTFFDPFEKHSSQILSSRRDLDRFLRRWRELQTALKERKTRLRAEGEAARRALDELSTVCDSNNLPQRIPEWQEAYAKLKQASRPRLDLFFAKFDALSKRIVCSREPLRQFWSSTGTQVRGMKLWRIRPVRFVANFIQEFALTANFAMNFRTGSRGNRRA